MPSSPIVQLLIVFGLASCLLALWKGGPAERLGAGFILGNMALGRALGAAPESLGPTLDLVNDALIAVAFLALTLRYGAVWLGVAMLLYAGQFALHSYYVVLDLPNDRLHARVNNLIFVSVILCIVVGTVNAWRRRARPAVPGSV